MISPVILLSSSSQKIKFKKEKKEIINVYDITLNIKNYTPKQHYSQVIMQRLKKRVLSTGLSL